MKKCKIFNKTGEEIGTIMILRVNNHKVGIAMPTPYVETAINEGYNIEINDDEIIKDLLIKANIEEYVLKF